MTRRTFSSQERLYIDSYKHDAEEALKDLIEDLKTARSRIAGHACRRGWECAGFRGLARLIPEIIHRGFA